MFDTLPGTGITESWAEALRRRKGIDRWPLVEAKIIYREVIPGDEGPDRYKLTLRYKPLSGPTSDTFWTKSLTVTAGTTLAGVDVDDTVQIYCHPEDPERIAQKDVTQLAYDIRGWLVMGAFLVFFLCLLLSGHLKWDGGD